MRETHLPGLENGQEELRKLLARHDDTGCGARLDRPKVNHGAVVLFPERVQNGVAHVGQDTPLVVESLRNLLIYDRRQSQGFCPGNNADMITRRS